MADIAFTKPTLPRNGALVLLLPEDGAGGGTLHEAAIAATEGRLPKALEAAGFKGKKGQTATLWAPGGGLSKIVAIGLGKPSEITAANLEAVGGTAWPLIAAERESVIAAEDLAPELAARIGSGAKLRSYRFDKYRTKEKEEDKPKAERIAIATSDPAQAKAAFAPLAAIAEGIFLARDLVSEPPNILFPVEMAERCRVLEKLGVVVEILGPKEMKKLGFGALMGVAQGSVQEPRMVVMKWMGAPKSTPRAKKLAKKPLCFVGKGVTFDTGGISIKPAGGMEEMKFDMAGAGTVIGLMAALAGRKAKADVIGLVGLVENMPSGNAQRPGDVVTSYSGQTIEIINTDAEGRLVLADVLWYAQEKYDPAFMVDLATLTGAIIVALGHEHAGMFSNDDALSEKLEAAGKATGELVWRMPLGEVYDKQIKSDIADMKNVGGRPGGSITAAQFIQRFVNGKPWVHLDIAGTAWAYKDVALIPKGASAYGVRLLDRLVADNFED
jgi:leucyl aminopeptidase